LAGWAAEVEFRRPSFHLRAEEEVEEDVPVIDAPNRAVRVELHAEARRALEQRGRRLRAHGALEPATPEPRSAQPNFHVGAAAHDLPDQSGPVVLDHEDE